MVTRYGYSLVLLCVFASCKTYNYQNDNPGIRALQAESLAESTSSRIGGLSLDDFFGPRTGLILPNTSAFVRGKSLRPGQVYTVGGRAAAISEDGYYLTAYHVVDGAVPAMFLPPSSKTRNGVGVSGTIRDPVFSHGDVIKHFCPADVALVKFDHRPKAHFEEILSNPKPGLEVFTGATDGITVGEERIGNGPFKSRGVILEIEDLEQGTSGHRIVTSIVARGGMSGAPVVDLNGSLVGILVGGKSSKLTKRFISSDCEIVPATEILRAIEMDRQSRTSNKLLKDNGAVPAESQL